MIGDRMAPFKAADRFRFFVDTTPYLFSAGQYGSGEGALVVHCIDGEPECKLTVSLANYGAPTLGPGELWVKLPELDEGAGGVGAIHRALLELGVFEDTGDRCAQGRSTNYAARWRFAPCATPRHDGVYVGAYRIGCAQCLAIFEAAFVDGETRMMAKDSVRMIKRLPREAL